MQEIKVGMIRECNDRCGKMLVYQDEFKSKRREYFNDLFNFKMQKKAVAILLFLRL